VLVDDGKGRGYKAAVDAENRLETYSIEQSIEHHINHLHGRGYHIIFQQAPTAGDDCIFYMQNSSEIDLVLEEISLYVSGACEITLQFGNIGTRNAANDVTPVNTNAGSGNTADGIFEQGADLDGGAATLTAGTVVAFYKFSAESTTNQIFNFSQDLIIPKNQTLTIWCNAVQTIYCTIPVNYHSSQ